MKLITILCVVITILANICISDAQGKNQKELLMDDNETFKILKGKPRSELQEFASWFHQDYETVYPNFFVGVNMYRNTISIERLEILKKQLSEFIELHDGTSNNDLKNAWFELGAQSWQHNLDIKNTLPEFLRYLEEDK